MSYKINTNCIQAGYSPKNGEPRVLPIYQSTTFKYDSSAEMGDLFDLKASGFFYSRLQNPTCDAVAAKIAALEGGVAAVLTSSGQSANFFALFNIAGAGDHIICSSALYGGTFNLISVTMKRMGIDSTFVDPECSPEELDSAFRPNTKAVFAESLSNPSLCVLDFEKFANAAHKNGVPLIVDNTFPTPINCRPFEFGADIVTHSTTKYMEGHACTIGGAVVDSGKFKWTDYPEKFAPLIQPDESYHGISYTESFKEGAYITKMTVQLMRDLGCTPAPASAFLLNHGLETLHLRVKRHCENALAVAKWLEKHPDVKWVDYPGLESSRHHALAERYMPNGTSGVIAFGLEGGRDRAMRFMDSLKLAAVVTHVADARTCVLHPASTTHRQMTDEQLISCGVSPDLIRLSVGIEDLDDIISDLEQAIGVSK